MVLDEADLLLTGGYERDTKRILSAFREGDRARSAGAAAAKLGLGAEQMAALPRHMRRAAEQGARRGAAAAVCFAELCLLEAVYSCGAVLNTPLLLGKQQHVLVHP